MLARQWQTQMNVAYFTGNPAYAIAAYSPFAAGVADGRCVYWQAALPFASARDVTLLQCDADFEISAEVLPIQHRWETGQYQLGQVTVWH